MVNMKYEEGLPGQRQAHKDLDLPWKKDYEDEDPVSDPTKVLSIVGCGE